VSSTKIARRYAKALSEVCDEAANHGVIQKQLTDFAALWSEAHELRGVMKSPVIDLDQKQDVLDAITTKAMVAPATRRFLGVLLQRNRIDAVGEISDAFTQLMDDRDKRVRAEVRSAVAMEAGDLTRIQNSLERITGKSVSLDSAVDASLLGGVQVQIGNLVLDASIRSQLDSIKERLLN
jgi:F-type H+-transporting ATPase subunit delta